MKTGLLLSLILFILPAQEEQGGYPVPPETPSRLFYIQHTNSHNTYVYDAKLIGSNRLDNKEPIDVYRLNYDSGKGDREELSGMQRKMAYGVDVIKNSHNMVEFCLAAYPAKKLLLKQPSGSKPYVMVQINGKNIILRKMFLFCNRWGTKVSHIDFYGRDAVANKDLKERLFIEK